MFKEQICGAYFTWNAAEGEALWLPIWDATITGLSAALAAILRYLNWIERGL
jgi:hypothetical protein